MQYPLIYRKFLIYLLISLFLFMGNLNAIYAESQQKNKLDTIKHVVSKPFKRTESAYVEELQQPALLWIRLRNQFRLPNHEHDPRVQYYIKRYTQSQNYFNDIINSARPYLYFISEEIEKRGMPSEIALLPMVESTFDPTALSSSGARGLWQIMPETGKYYGLSQDEWFDGCQDIMLSTKAALSHLDYLSKRFKGNWMHALAAYNSGEGRVSRAINKNLKESKSIEFWHLNLPQETRDYVPKLMALVAIIKSPSKYGIVLPSILNQPYFTHIDIGKAIDIKEAAVLAKLPEKKLTHLNPGFYKKRMNPDGPFELCVPVHLAENVCSIALNMPSIPKYSAESHRTKKGETLSKIAKQYNTNIQTLKVLNNLSSDVIRVGQNLKLPAQTNRQVAAKTKPNAADKDKIHVVKRGDSLWSISKQHQVSIKDMMAKNNLSKKSTLQPGQKIVIETA